MSVVISLAEQSEIRIQIPAPSLTSQAACLSYNPSSEVGLASPGFKERFCLEGIGRLVQREILSPFFSLLSHL